MEEISFTGLEECILRCDRIGHELEEQKLQIRQTLGGELMEAYKTIMQAVIQQMEQVSDQLREVELLEAAGRFSC